MHRRFWTGSAFLLTVIFLYIGCATTGPGGEKSLILISKSQEVAIGKQVAAEVDSTQTILEDSLWQAYINDLGQRIVAVSDRRDLSYHFAIIASDEINAFATPGGYVYFYSGLITKMDSESELAGVLAHEISHVVARHSVKQLQSVMGASVLLQLALGESSATTQNLAGVALAALMSGYSRSMESEADEFGVVYMTRAGWNPNGMVDMFKKLASLRGSSQSNFIEHLFSSHPTPEARIEDTQEQIAKHYSPLPKGLIVDTERFHTMKARLPQKEGS
jgi:predicted Zn-dependent protease